MKTVYFIPARKGSKEVSGKNMKLLRDKPLISYVIDAIIGSGAEGDIWVATDWDKLKEYVINRYNGRVSVFDRSEANAQDTSPTIDVVMEFLTQQEVNRYDNFVLLQATSPFTTTVDVKILNDIMCSNKYDSVVGCCRLKRFRWAENGTSLDYNLTHKPRRQEYKGFLIESGSFYASKTEKIYGGI